MLQRLQTAARALSEASPSDLELMPGHVVCSTLISALSVHKLLHVMQPTSSCSELQEHCHNIQQKFLPCLPPSFASRFCNSVRELNFRSKSNGFVTDANERKAIIAVCNNFLQRWEVPSSPVSVVTSLHQDFVTVLSMFGAQHHAIQTERGGSRSLDTSSNDASAIAVFRHHWPALHTILLSLPISNRSDCVRASRMIGRVLRDCEDLIVRNASTSDQRSLLKKMDLVIAAATRLCTPPSGGDVGGDSADRETLSSMFAHDRRLLGICSAFRISLVAFPSMKFEGSVAQSYFTQVQQEFTLRIELLEHSKELPSSDPVKSREVNTLSRTLARLLIHTCEAPPGTVLTVLPWAVPAAEVMLRLLPDSNFLHIALPIAIARYVSECNLLPTEIADFVASLAVNPHLSVRTFGLFLDWCHVSEADGAAGKRPLEASVVSTIWSRIDGNLINCLQNEIFVSKLKYYILCCNRVILRECDAFRCTFPLEARGRELQWVTQVTAAITKASIRLITDGSSSYATRDAFISLLALLQSFNQFKLLASEPALLQRILEEDAIDRIVSSAAAAGPCETHVVAVHLFAISAHADPLGGRTNTTRRMLHQRIAAAVQRHQHEMLPRGEDCRDSQIKPTSSVVQLSELAEALVAALTIPNPDPHSLVLLHSIVKAATMNAFFFTHRRIPSLLRVFDQCKDMYSQSLIHCKTLRDARVLLLATLELLATCCERLFSPLREGAERETLSSSDCWEFRFKIVDLLARVIEMPIPHTPLETLHRRLRDVLKLLPFETIPTSGSELHSLYHVAWLVRLRSETILRRPTWRNERTKEFYQQDLRRLRPLVTIIVKMLDSRNFFSMFSGKSEPVVVDQTPSGMLSQSLFFVVDAVLLLLLLERRSGVNPGSFADSQLLKTVRPALSLYVQIMCTQVERLHQTKSESFFGTPAAIGNEEAGSKKPREGRLSGRLALTSMVHTFELSPFLALTMEDREYLVSTIAKVVSCEAHSDIIGPQIWKGLSECIAVGDVVFT